MADTKLSNLAAGAAVAATDLLYNVQSAGAGGVKTTAAQIKTFTSASPTLVTPALGVATATSIAIGGATLGGNALAITGHVLVEGVASTGATGTGKIVFDGTPTLVTPVLGVATATSINKVAITAPAGSATLTIADGKTLTVNNILTFAGTDSTTMTFPTTNATIARTDAANTFTGHQTIEGVTSTGATGTGKFVFDGTPTLVTPVLGVATGTSIALGGATLGANALAVTGHVLVEGVASTGATGTGKFVFDGSPTLVTPNIGTPSAGVLTNCTGYPLIADICYVIDGGGSALTSGTKGYLEIPFACTINRVTALADTSGSVTCNLWRTTYASFDSGVTHPVAGDKIDGSAPVTLTTAYKYQDATLTGWTTSISAGDVLGFNISGTPATITRLTYSIKVTKTT